jgi:excinuclease ABC subunit C
VNEDILSWRPKTGDIPKDPGVYKWRDENGRVIYVGKAKNLRNRLTSYFQYNRLPPRIQRMVKTARSLEWTVVSNEIEALTLEYSWIHQFNPRFNVIFRNDDKSYPYLAIDNSNTFGRSTPVSRVHITREKKKKKSKYFGPYPQAWAIHSTFEILQKTYQFRTCSPGVFKGAERQGRPCLLGYIDKCMAPCINKELDQKHEEAIDKIQRFLKGDISSLKNDLKQKMKNFSENMEYEKAAEIRDQIEAIEIVATKNSAELDQNANLDVIGVNEDEIEAGVHIFFIRKGAIIGEKIWITEGNENLVENILAQMYIQEKLDIPPEIVVPSLPEKPIIDLLEGIRGTNIDVHVGQRGDKRSLLEKANDNAKHNLEKAKKRRATDLTSRTQAIEEVREALEMNKPPMRMECYDVSHTLGNFQTASMVVFEEGLVKKEYYRLFNLKGSKGEGVPDDTAAIYEVICRRLSYVNGFDIEKATAKQYILDDIKNNRSKTNQDKQKIDQNNKKFAYDPDLLIMDGGQPQVNAAYKAICDMGFQNKIQVCSLAKRLEEVWIPNEDYPIIFPRDSLGLYLLQQLRDESHRFSIVNMRKRRSKAMFD